MMILIGINKMDNRAINIIKIKEKDLKNYKQVKSGESFQVNDFVHIIDEEYAQISSSSILLKKKIDNSTIVLRKK